MFWTFPLVVQCYDSNSNNWYTKTFDTQKIMTEYVQSQFKIPGQYNLRDTQYWQTEGLNYTARHKESGKSNFEGGYYTDAVKGTLKHKAYWANEKDKVLKGVIIDNIYIPPFYYWYLNYCPIYDAVKKVKRLGDPWDSDLWYCHYVMLGMLKGKHIGGVKGRQKGYSYKHMAILYWVYSWFESSVNTIGAFDERLVKKSWRFLEGYRKHINSTTVWKRGPKQAKSLEWNEVTFDINEVARGNQSKLSGVTFQKNAENDVGGSQTIFNYEEPGVAPTLLQTLEYIKPALERGSMVTGLFIACGSVGELEHAAGLKKIFYNPDDYNFLSVINVWDTDPNFVGKKCCIFISEAYNMPGKDDVTGLPFMDKNGNSNVELALAWIEREQAKIKASNKDIELKQIAISQKCTSPQQAFDERKNAFFPTGIIKNQQNRIALRKENGSLNPKRGLLEAEIDGSITLHTGNLPREHGFPIEPQWQDKRGVVTIYEPPDKNSDWLTYFAGVDTIEAEITSTSESVFTIYIFKTVIEVTYSDTDGKLKVRKEGDKVVATYVGRFDNTNGGVNATNEQGELLIKLYNAFAYVERNKPNFINHMQRKGLGRYLATEKDVPLFKDMNNGNTSNSNYGFYMDSTGKMNDSLNKVIREYLLEEYDAVYKTNADGTQSEEIVKIYRGVDRIDDYYALEELRLYTENLNTDRRVALGAAILIAKVFQTNRYIKRRSEVKQIEAPRTGPQQGFTLLPNRPPKQRSLL